MRLKKLIIAWVESLLKNRKVLGTIGSYRKSLFLCFQYISVSVNEFQWLAILFDVPMLIRPSSHCQYKYPSRGGIAWCFITQNHWNCFVANIYVNFFVSSVQLNGILYAFCRISAIFPTFSLNVL